MPNRPTTDGLVLVDKPVGPTSHDVVQIVRRALRERRIGHAGTLDPFATGLLVLLTGRATRLLPYVDGEPKIYDARIPFGAETDTDDLTGTVVRTAEPPTREAIDAAIATLTGEIDQTPPAYSAKQVGGERAYDAARRGEPLDLKHVRVTVHSWVVRSYAGAELDVTITCSGGTYIRALARDLGRLTGSAAHLSALRRTASGSLSVEDAVSLDDLKAGLAQPLSPLEALGAMPAQTLDDDEIGRVVRGMAVPTRVEGERAALVDGDNTLVAIARRNNDRWQPRVVLRDA
jgi:tRNA pseudouridine55 synthase